MRMSMALTLDGMIRALRMRGHDLAERIEVGVEDEAEPPRSARIGRQADRRGDEGDDQRRD